MRARVRGTLGRSWLPLRGGESAHPTWDDPRPVVFPRILMPGWAVVLSGPGHVLRLDGLRGARWI